MTGDEVCLNITINDDNLCEGNEAFSVVLQSNDTALSLPPAATIIIVDDDGRENMLRNTFTPQWKVL